MEKQIENLEKAKKLFKHLKDSYPDAPNFVHTELDEEIEKCDKLIKKSQDAQSVAEFVDFNFEENVLTIGGKPIRLEYQGQSNRLKDSLV